LLAAAAFFFLTREREPASVPSQENETPARAKPAFPRVFWLFLVGVFLFGLGDFSRTFLILLASASLGEAGTSREGMLSVAVLLYAMHNLISAAAAYGIGHLGDKTRKLPLLVGGYALGVMTNLLLMAAGI